MGRGPWPRTCFGFGRHRRPRPLNPRGWGPRGADGPGQPARQGGCVLGRRPQPRAAHTAEWRTASLTPLGKTHALAARSSSPALPARVGNRGAVSAGVPGRLGGRPVRGRVRHFPAPVANPRPSRKSMLPKGLRRVRRASSPLRHSHGRPQVSAPGTPPGDTPAIARTAKRQRAPTSQRRPRQGAAPPEPARLQPAPPCRPPGSLARHAQRNQRRSCDRPIRLRPTRKPGRHGVPKPQKKPPGADAPGGFTPACCDVSNRRAHRLARR